MIQLTKEKL